MKTRKQWALRPVTPEELWTDREWHLNSLHDWSLKAITRRTSSTVLLGRRRLGKTEIFKQIVNRLFFEQDHRDPEAAVPVYYSIRDDYRNEYHFTAEYISNYLRWHLAFRNRDIRYLDIQGFPDRKVADAVRSDPELARMMGYIPEYLEEALEEKGPYFPTQTAIKLPRSVADREDTTAVIFIDEFQNTLQPQNDFNIVSCFHESVESRTCPHFVTGSALSIIQTDILGRGSLFGRFHGMRIEPLTEYFGAELALKVARYNNVELPEIMAPAAAARCGSNPFYITAVVRYSADLGKPILDESALDEVLAEAVSGGPIWAELADQVNRWIDRMNEYGITKWVLYLSALEDEERISLERIKHELWERDRQDVSLETIRDVLIKLSKGDLVEYGDFGGWFRKMDDPILLDFLKVWGQVVAEGRDISVPKNRLREEYEAYKRRVADHKGYLAEIYMTQVLWNAQDKGLPGRLFNQAQDVKIPRFTYIHQRVNDGGLQVDVKAAAGPECWLCESKYRRDRKVNTDEVERLQRQLEIFRADRGDRVPRLRAWFFSRDGFTEEAREFMDAKGMFYSERADLDELLAMLGLRTLPEL